MAPDERVLPLLLLVELGLADTDKVGITGGSYGGYMVMAGLTEYPEAFAAGANLFGNSILALDARAGRRLDDEGAGRIQRTVALGLIDPGDADLKQLIKDERYKPFYMHKTGHWIGMDVHDVGDYKVDSEWRMLEPGMVLTVEPGLYIPLGMRGVAKKWQGIGIRIEDDVLVTKDGHEVLTAGAPKEIDEIEALMA